MRRNEYDSVFERVANSANDYLAARAREIGAAKSLMPSLLEQCPEDRSGTLSDPRYHSLELVNALLERSREWMGESSVAIEAASLAVVIAGRLDSARYGVSAVEEARARAWSYLGNGWRIAGDLRSAVMALRMAAEHLVAVGGDPFLEAEILNLTASLRDSQGQHAAALPLLDRARSIYREAGDRRLEGRCLILKGMVLGNACHHRKAIYLTRKGMSRFRLEDDPALVLGAQHNLMLYLAASGRPRKARSLLAKTRAAYVELGDWSLLLNLRWLDGIIARQSGDLGVAESCLWMVRDGFLDRGLELDAALAMQQVAEIYAHRGCWSHARRLAAEVIPVFEGQGALKRAEAARRLFTRADS